MSDRSLCQRISTISESNRETLSDSSLSLDVMSVVEGTDVNDVIEKLERFAATSLAWADNNAVRFERSKTEAILFSSQGDSRAR